MLGKVEGRLMTRNNQINKYWESESEKLLGRFWVNIIIRKGILDGVKSYKFNKENWLDKGYLFLFLKMGLVQVNLELIDSFDLLMEDPRTLGYQVLNSRQILDTLQRR